MAQEMLPSVRKTTCVQLQVPTRMERVRDLPGGREGSPKVPPRYWTARPLSSGRLCRAPCSAEDKAPRHTSPGPGCNPMAAGRFAWSDRCLVLPPTPHAVAPVGCPALTSPTQPWTGARGSAALGRALRQLPNHTPGPGGRITRYVNKIRNSLFPTLAPSRSSPRGLQKMSAPGFPAYCPKGTH